uniref:Uncharacterized protein n=1 Tax=Aegilops tauschii subsp. strangulata TaxID=200361 RepID=A0A452YVZ5_AEGTS
MRSYAAEIEEPLPWTACARLLASRATGLLSTSSAAYPQAFSGEPRRTRGYWMCKPNGVTGLHREISGGGLQFAPDHRARTGNRRVRRPMPSFPCEGCRVYAEPCSPLRALALSRSRGAQQTSVDARARAACQSTELG